MMHGKGKPEDPGLYACEIHFGWKLLEWDGECWHFPERTARWEAGDPVQWVGPLPDRREAASPGLEFCAVCGLVQAATPRGMVCVNGHGGAPGLEFDL